MADSVKTKARNWSITINNPTEEDYSQIEQMKSSKTWFREWVGQVEKGESGTVHIQAYLKTDNVSFSQVKKCLPRAHIEPARNALALKQYAQKEETRLSTLPQIKAAGLGDIQKELLSVVSGYLHHKGLPFHYKPIQMKSPGRWTYRKVELPEETEFPDVVKLNREWLDEMKDGLLDEVLEKMIMEGWYGVEMYGANNLTRSAFTKYFCAILIRTHAHLTSPPSPSRPEDPPTQADTLD